MKVFALLAFFAALASATVAQEPRLWFVFLTNGKAPRPEAAELQKMQTEHIANFQRLHKAGKLLMAGPLADPTQFKRGILALWVKDREEIMQCFEADRYVTTGIMDVAAEQWNMPKDRIASELPDPNAIEENRLAMLSARRPIPAYLLREHDRYIDQRVKPSLNGTLRTSDYREILMFQGKDDEALELMRRDPLVRLGFVTLEFMPLWMAKGALKPSNR